MTYVIGAIAGIAFGGLVGLAKGLFIWQKYEKKGYTDPYDQSDAGTIYIRAMVSYFTNIAALVVAFLIRNIVPFDGIAFLIATALSLAVMNHVWTIRQKSYIKSAERRSD